jgi:hypothetical protein
LTAYTHMRREDLTAALGVLPDLSMPSVQFAKATGTDGAVGVSAHVSENRGFVNSSEESHRDETLAGLRTKNPEKQGKLTQSDAVAKVMNPPGGVAEWSIAPVLKTGGPARVP